MADNIRSIPSVADGLKPGQRKVIFGCIKRKLKKEIKVTYCRTTPNVASSDLDRFNNLSVMYPSTHTTTMVKSV